MVLPAAVYAPSPTRRCPDWAVHRILSKALAGEDRHHLRDEFYTFTQQAASHSSAAEVTAMRLERDCDDFYKAESTVTGKRELKEVVIAPEAVDPEDVEMLQDMIVAAVNEALRAAESDSASTMQQLTGGLGLPF